MPLENFRRFDSTLRISCLALAAAVIAGTPPRLDAQSDTANWALVAPGPDYEASGMWRFFFGGDYRDLWTTPTKVEILNLQTYAGGLTPVRAGGGQQTKSLRLRAPDGRQFNFRSVDKDPSAVLPPDLRGTFADDIVQDQIGSAHPTGALVSDRLLTAAGVIHASPQFFRMPDDPALGEFRATFANMLGLFEEHVEEGATRTPGVENATKIIDMEKLLERLEERPSEHIDTLAWLKARLMDVYMGDWDRHRGQWRWARVGPDSPETAWVPIPEDRDQVFVSYDGFLLWIARQTRPQLVKFGKKYPRIIGATYNGRELDRQLFAAVERPVWDSMASHLQRVLTDAVIDSAVRALPVQQYRIDGARLSEALRVRRDKIPQMSDDYYEYLATEPEMHGTDMAERVTITRGGATDRDDVEVLIVGKDTVNGAPVEVRSARRVFLDRDTHEFRIYLHGGDDSVYVRGNGSGKLKIRIIGGGGADAVVDSSDAGGVRFYDSGERSTLAALHGGRLRTKPYTRPDTTTPVPPRDWGNYRAPLLWSAVSPDIGVFLGFGFSSTDYAFRKYPYGSRHVFRAGYATEAKTFRAEFKGEWRWENSGVHTNIWARASGVEILRFYGFGNETPNTGDRDFFKVQQDQFLLEPSITVPFSRQFEMTLGPRAQFSRLDENADRFINTFTDLYGAGDFGQVGGRLALSLDTRDVPAAARKGVLFNVEGTVYPGFWDVESTFGKVRGDLSTYLSASAATLALRVGGEKVFGDLVPFHEAAYVGGRSTLRGWDEQRFAGEAAAYGNAELRLRLTRMTILVPTDVGVFGLADVGRVYVDGETSDEWHTGFGGGVSLSFFQRVNTLTVAVATSEERTGVYIRAGFLF
jgi:Omp85 superfamily domain